MEYRDETVEQEDFYQMYLDDLQEIVPCTEPEREILLSKAARGDESAKKRLVEGHLKMVLELAADYMDGALSPGDVIQEANMALLAAVDGALDGSIPPEPSDIPTPDGLTPMVYTVGKCGILY